MLRETKVVYRGKLDVFKKILKGIILKPINALRRIKGVGYNRFGSSSMIRKPIRIIGKKYISIGKNVYIMDGIRMEAISKWIDQSYEPQIIIMDDVNIGQNCHITCANRIRIGKGVSISPDVAITDIEHEYVCGRSVMNTGLKVGEVDIGDFVTIGMGARILGHKHIKIGDSAVIGANAIVTDSIPPNTVVAGIPAKIIKVFS